jgi:uncharacterized protein
MNSLLYTCRLLHHRVWPREHRFNNRVFLFAIDLDELDRLHTRLRLFSRNRRNLYSFRDADYLPGEGSADEPRPDSVNLKARVQSLLRRHAIELGQSGRVVLVTLPRIAGYQFNPVSFYFCSAGAEPVCAIVEVSNTFGEVKNYLLGPDTVRPDGSLRLRTPKHFYVSPFSDAGTEFDFLLRRTPDALAVRIDEYHGERRILRSVLTGTPRELRDRTLADFALRYPLLSLQVSLRIRTQALRLYRKGVPWRRKADQPALQRDFHVRAVAPPGGSNPHASR